MHFVLLEIFKQLKIIRESFTSDITAEAIAPCYENWELQNAVFSK